MIQEPDIERALGPIEQMLWRLDELCRFNCVAHAEVLGRVSDAHLVAGLAGLQHRHPLLRVRIEARGRARFRSGVGPIPLRCTEMRTDDWTNTLHDELHASLPVDHGPLARAVFLRHERDRSTLLLTFHHAIGDGLSGAFLMRDLLQATALAAEGQATRLAALPPRNHLHAHLPQRARGWRGWLGYARGLRRALRSVRSLQPMGRLPRDGSAPLTQRQVFTVPHIVQPAIVKRLAARARREGTTLHGALAAALALATARDMDGTKPVGLVYGFPVDLRDRLRPPIGEDCGAYATGAAAYLRLSGQESFWESAREVRLSLQRSVRREDHLFLAPRGWQLLAAFAGAFPRSPRGNARLARWLERVPPVGASLALSNMGRLTIASCHGSLQMRALGVVASPSVLGLLSSTATILDDLLVWHIGGMEPLLSRTHIRRLGEQAVGLLCGAADVPEAMGRPATPASSSGGWKASHG